MRPGAVDRLKMRLLLGVRRVNRAAIESWSRSSFRRARPSRRPVDPIAAAVPGLWIPHRLPRDEHLPAPYELAYYGLAGTAFVLYRRFPIPPSVAWSEDVDLELVSDEGWNAIDEDDEFAQMRLAGPNPYLLERAEDGGWTVDYGPSFDGVHPPVRCEFELSGGKLVARAIRIGDRAVRRGEEGWEHAKLVANALDARYTVFVQHLLTTHLVVAQAYALAASVLPHGHRLRAFMDVHTYGVLRVNHFAWKLLITPTSYFIQSSFITERDALRLLENGTQRFSFDRLVPEMDAAARGLDAFPHHPYLETARAIWPIMRAYAAEVAEAWPDDEAVREDAPLRAWHARLVSLFPNPTPTLQRLETRDDLILLMTCLVFNNVIHEVSGDFSPYATSTDPQVKRLVNLERLMAGDDGPVRLNDVFLFEQGAFAGMFNTAGNNMLRTPLDGFVDDRAFLECLRRFRESLARLDDELARDRRGGHELRRMRPRQWELSVSF